MYVCIDLTNCYSIAASAADKRSLLDASRYLPRSGLEMPSGE